MAINDVRNDSLYGSNKVIVGTKYSDLILETLGKVYIKTGNSSRVLNDVFKLLDNADDSGKSTILVNSLLEMESMEYPGDGYFIFNTLTKGLYLSYDNRYILLIEAAEGADLGYVRRSGDTMTGLLEIVTKTAPLIVASSKLVRNFNAEYVNGFSSDDLAKRKLDEYIIGRWSFNNITTFNDNIVANDNIRAYKDIVLSGSIGSPEFASGFGGYGWRFDANTNMLTVDYLVVRKAMRVYELVINNISATNGALWVTNASKCEESKIPLYLDDTYSPGDLTGKTWYIPITSNSNNVSEVVIKGLNLANSDGTNPGDLTFINHKFAVYINDIQKVLNSPRFLGINSITDEAILNLELDDDFSLNVKICYLFAKDSSNNIIWYNENTTPKFYFINKNRVTVNSDSHQSYYNGEVDELYLYYKYFAILKEEYLASLLSNKQVPHIRLVTTDTSLYPSFKEGDLIRCLKYSYGNMKYYDAIVGTLFDSNTFVMFRASSVFDKYTEISYDEFGNVINYKEEYNTLLYLKTTQTIDLDSILDDITALDNMVLVGNVINPERLNSVYITSAEDNSPFIDIITDLNRPDWSVLYYVPNYLTEVRYVEEYGMRKRCKLYLLNTLPTETIKYWTWVDNGVTYYGTLIPTKNTNVLYYSEEAKLKLCKFTTTTKVRLGNLSGITNDMFKTSLPYGYGLYGENVFLTGEFYLSNGQSVVEFTKDQIKLEILGSVSKNYILNSRGPFEIKNTTLESPGGGSTTIEFTKLFLLKKSLTRDSDMYIYWTELDVNGEINLSLSHIRAFLKFKDLDSPLLEVYNNTIFRPNNEYDALIIKGNNYLGSVEKLMLSLGTTKYDWEPAELDVIGSSFEMTEDGITLVGKEILLKGLIKFEYLDALTQDNLKYLTLNLRDATKESTLILGGLILSNTLALGKTETIEGSEDEKKFTIYSGLSGNYDESLVGNGISYWSGGDAFDRASMPPELYPEGVRPASSLIRMDGSGYLANGNIEWDVDGNLYVNPLTFWIDIVGGESETLEKILNKLVNLFSPVYEDPLDDLSAIVGIYAKYPLAVLGGITLYTGVPLTLPSIFEGLPIDGDTIYWELDSSGNKAILKAKGGTGGASNWDELEGKPTWITDTKPQYTWTEIQNKPSWITTDKPEYSYTEITGLTDELARYVTLTTDQSISGMKNFTNGMKVSGTLFKVINGVLTLDCSLAVTGGITAFAIGEQSVSTIMNGIACDEKTIHVNSFGKLEVIGGTGGGLDDVTVTGTGNAVTSASLSNNILTLTKGSAFALSEHTHTIADLTNATGLFTALSSSSSTNLSVTVGGTTKTIADLYATTAEKLSTNAGATNKPVYFSNGIPVNCSYTFGNASGNAAINNGILCTNLNADKLDSLDSKDFCRRYDLGSSVDGEGFYVVLGPAYNSTALTGFSFQGNISLKRGDAGRWHGESLINCMVGAQYTNNLAKYFFFKDNSITVDGFYKIYYNSSYYIALKVSTVSSIQVSLFGIGYNNFNPFLIKQSLVSSETVISNSTTLTADNASFDCIDFHYANSSDDYTSRIIESASGLININNRIYAELDGQAAVVASCVTANNATEWKTCCFSIAGNTSRQYGVNIWNTQNGIGHIQSGYIKNTTSYFNLALQEFGGNVGIGTTSPSYKLDVNGSTRSNTYYINTGYGTNYISQGTGDGANYTTHNMKIRCHYGLGFYGNADTCQMFINAREGSLSAKGSISSSIFYINGIKMYKHSDGTVMLDGNLAVTGGVTVYASNSISYDGFNVQRINIKGTNESNGYISADSSYNMYFNVNSKSLLVLDGNSVVVRPSTSLANTVDLGSSSTPWKNGYFKGFHINNDSNTLSSDVTLIAKPSSSNPYFGMYYNGKRWYMQGYNSVLMLGTSSANSIQITDTGNLKVPGTVSQGSDIRLKTGISTLENRGYITPKTFWKDGIRQIGFIAQDVQALYPELVLDDGSENHYLSLNYSQMVAVLEAQIIELKNKIEELENKLNAA